ncbi:MAG: hypothetical protein WDW38_001091 [Sanguina aurantia]
MAVARFDFSYGTMEYHQQTLDNLKLAQQQSSKLCAVMLDTMGPEIIVLNRCDSLINIVAGQTITLSCNSTLPASSTVLPISYPTLLHTGIQPGASIFVGQYLFTGSETSSVYLTVQEIHGDNAVCVANNSCILEGLQLTVHISTMKNEAPILSEYDVQAISKWGLRNRIDYVSLSFCRSAADVAACRGLLDRCGLKQTLIMAKLENLEGLTNYKEILDVADLILFSRGNLGICLDPEKVFLSQKLLLRECNLAGKPVFVTRVVDTMTDAPRPTRAEATDVANLVLDGTDGILLGSETFRGKYVIQTMNTVLAICKQAEKCFDQGEYYRSLMEYFGAYTANPNMSKAEALASSAVRAADKINAALIIVFTVTGRTARLVAKYKPAQKILTLVVPSLNSDGLKWHWTGDYQARQCLAVRGCVPISVDANVGSEAGKILNYAIEYAKAHGLVKVGDTVVVSQCPRHTDSSVMQEAGVVKLVTVTEQALPYLAQACGGCRGHIAVPIDPHAARHASGLCPLPNPWLRAAAAAGDEAGGKPHTAHPCPVCTNSDLPAAAGFNQGSYQVGSFEHLGNLAPASS